LHSARKRWTGPQLLLVLSKCQMMTVSPIKEATVSNRKARAMHYAVSAFRRMESVAYAGLIEDEIDLQHVLPVALTQPDHQEPRA
jgi:hypothetical protein